MRLPRATHLHRANLRPGAALSPSRHRSPQPVPPNSIFVTTWANVPRRPAAIAHSDGPLRSPQVLSGGLRSRPQRGCVAAPGELLIGADKNSEWSNGKLVIAANHGPSISCKLRSTLCGSKCSNGSWADGLRAPPRTSAKLRKFRRNCLPVIFQTKVTGL